MGKIAFVFAGQGSQYSGMGQSLYNLGGSAKKLYDMAETIRPGTIKQSFSGTEDELKKTSNTQPCLYLVDLASALCLNDMGIYADGSAGFSLGEIAALAYAGMYTDEDGFKIVTKRGELMDECSSKVDTAMTAVLKLDENTLKSALEEFDGLYAVNFNCPGQIVVSGLKSEMEPFSQRIKELGGRAVPLAVSAAFHSPFMDEASEKFADELKKFSFSDTAIPVYANLTALPYNGNASDTLMKQMKNPVLWQKTIENMISDGFTDFIEVGAGKTLSGLIRKISKDVRVYSVQDSDTLNSTVQAVKENA